MTEPRNERIPDELEPEVEDGRDEADQSDGLEMDSSWESMLDKRFADMADEQVVGLAQQGDSVAVEYLLSKYKNFVRSKARSYFLIGADHEDIVQEGMIGLFKAVRDYQPERLSSFRAFAELCITRQIITAIKTATRQKHVPLNSYVSLNKPIYDEESDRTLMDVIVEGRAQNPEELIIGQEDLVSIRDRVDQVLSGLEQDVLNAYLNLIFVTLFRESKIQADRSPNPKANMATILDYIEKNYQHVTLKDCADYVSYSSTYFCRLFKDNVGMTLTEYLNQKKIQAAMTLLTETDQSVESIIMNVGFNQRKYFYALFTAYTGMSPCEFRRRNRHKD